MFDVPIFRHESYDLFFISFKFKETNEERRTRAEVKHMALCSKRGQQGDLGIGPEPAKWVLSVPGF